MEPCTQAMLLGAVQVAGTFLTTVVIEKAGRKVLLIISDGLVCVSMIGVGVFFYLKENCSDCTPTDDVAVFAEKTTIDSLGWLPLVSLMVFILAFSVGLGPIPWVLNVEMIPPEARVGFLISIS